MFPAEAIPGILISYMAGLRASYAIAIACMGLATIFSLGSKWQKLNGVNVSGAA
jgi:hypothetical protein